jgi:hypothetical protein
MKRMKKRGGKKMMKGAKLTTPMRGVKRGSKY